MSEISAYRDGYTLGQHSMRTAAYEWGFEKGEQAERERIIGDILESEWKCGHSDCDADKTEVCYPRQELFAIIRGETK